MRRGGLHELTDEARRESTRWRTPCVMARGCLAEESEVLAR